MRLKRKKSEDHPDTHRWIISYADFITLLFAFFVVMYAISSVNVSKYRSLAEGMKSAFNQKDLNKATQSTAKMKDGPESRKTKGTFRDGLDKLAKALSEVASDGSFSINRKEGWIELDIKSGSLFTAGSADLTPEALMKLMRFAGKIKDTDCIVAVEGYTDNIPIETPQFPSNWDLSAARAAAVGRALNGFGISPSRLLITGYGDQFPIADNSTEQGRTTNRRVNIIITKNRSVDRLFNPGISQTPENFLGGGYK